VRRECVTARTGGLLKRATQAAVTALWSTFQQLKFGSSKVVPKDGESPKWYYYNRKSVTLAYRHRA